MVGAVAMSMAFMGPATSAAFNTQPAAAGVGYALPFAIFLALIGCLLVANTEASFARKLPTASFVYTFNTQGFGRDGGFLSGWLLLGYGMVGPMLFAAIGCFTSDFIEGILPRMLGTTDGSHVPQAALAGYMLFSLAYAPG